VETAGFQYIGAGLVSFQLRQFRVRYTVNFDDQLSVEGYEIDDIPIYRVLAATS
jgi:hypothetical protein